METQKKKPQRGRDWLRPTVKLEPGETCNIKKHFLGCAHEVVGYLEKKAKADPERFVWPHVPTITSWCNRYETKEPYKGRTVAYVLMWLRKLNIISKDLDRVRKGFTRRGFIVAPHDALCVRESTGCEYVGCGHAPGKWESTGPGGRLWWVAPGSTNVKPTFNDQKPQCSSAVQPSVQPENGMCADKCAVKCADENEKTSPQPTESLSTCAVGAVPSLVNLVSRDKSLALETVLPALNPKASCGQVDTTTKNPEPQSKTVSACASSFKGSTTDQKQKQAETILMHFGTTPNLAEITAGEFEPTAASEALDKEDLNDLEILCAEIIDQWAERFYLGRKTHGDLMAEAMVRFTKKTCREVPLYWYPIAKRLREWPPEKTYVRPKAVVEFKPAPPQPLIYPLKEILAEAAALANIDLAPFAEQLEHLMGFHNNYFAAFSAIKHIRQLKDFSDWLWDNRHKVTPLNNQRLASVELKDGKVLYYPA